jgi:hypothetical protein
MHKQVLVLTICALVLTYGGTAIAQGPMMPKPDQQQTQGQDDSRGQGGMMCGMMGQGGMMGRGMMRGGMMGGGAMGPPVMMRMIFALMDSDGDGTIELPEFQAAHERIFKAMDSNKDGKLTRDEMQAFMRGARRSVPSEQ